MMLTRYAKYHKIMNTLIYLPKFRLKLIMILINNLNHKMYFFFKKQWLTKSNVNKVIN